MRHLFCYSSTADECVNCLLLLFVHQQSWRPTWAVGSSPACPPQAGGCCYCPTHTPHRSQTPRAPRQSVCCLDWHRCASSPMPCDKPEKNKKCSINSLCDIKQLQEFCYCTSQHTQEKLISSSIYWLQLVNQIIWVFHSVNYFSDTLNNKNYLLFNGKMLHLQHIFVISGWTIFEGSLHKMCDYVNMGNISCLIRFLFLLPNTSDKKKIPFQSVTLSLKTI